MKRRRKPLSQAKKQQLAALHRYRIAETKAEVQSAIERMRQGTPRHLRVPFKWTLENLAREASRNVATLHRHDESGRQKVFESELRAFQEAKEAVAPGDRSRELLESEKKKRRSAETETRAKEAELARLLEQNLELAHRLSLLESIQANFVKSEEDVRRLRAENEKLRFQLTELTSSKEPKSPSQKASQRR